MRFGAVFNYFTKRYRADGAKLLIWAHSEMTEGHVDKLQHEEMPIRDKEKKNLHVIAQRARGERPQRCSEVDCMRLQVYFDLLGTRVWTRSPPEGPSNLDDPVVFGATCNLWANIGAILHREKI